MNAINIEQHRTEARQYRDQLESFIGDSEPTHTSISVLDASNDAAIPDAYTSRWFDWCLKIGVVITAVLALIQHA